MTEQMHLFPGVENLVLNSKVSHGTPSALPHTFPLHLQDEVVSCDEGTTNFCQAQLTHGSSSFRPNNTGTQLNYQSYYFNWTPEQNEIDDYFSSIFLKR